VVHIVMMMLVGINTLDKTTYTLLIYHEPGETNDMELINCGFVV